MPFEKSPPELVARFDQLAAAAPEATRKMMFGYPSLVLGGHMFMGLFEEELVLRLGDDDGAALMGAGGLEFAPMAGRVMTGYVVVPRELVADTGAMAGWVERALAHAQSLPPKKPKAKKVGKGAAPSR
jgi:TfoX/Sxy family transcriptional regulator of competence genes